MGRILAVLLQFLPLVLFVVKEEKAVEEEIDREREEKNNCSCD